MIKSKSTQKRSASKKKSSVKRGAVKAASKSSKGASKRMKSAVSARRGAVSTAPVVYQTLREQVDAVNTNVGATESLGDFLASTDW